MRRLKEGKINCAKGFRTYVNPPAHGDSEGEEDSQAGSLFPGDW
jgi:hypothetical protein